jgi:ABC-type uncharacterized transport system substrate-binding protein
MIKFYKNAGFVLVFIMMAPFIFAQKKVVIILSSEIMEYQQAASGISMYLTRVLDGRYSVEELNLQTIRLEDIKRIKPVVIIAVGTKALKYSFAFLKDIPVVFCMVVGNVKPFMSEESTGVTMDIPVEKKVDLLKSIQPNTATIGYFY